MPIESCPKCGGTRSESVSPGIERCTSEVRHVETVMVPDQASPYPYAMRPADYERTRVCGHVYEVETPMVEAECQLGPEGSGCGAFATGRCSECHRYTCRHHSFFFEGRLLCADCKTAIEQARAEEAQEAEHQRQAESNSRAAEARRRERQHDEEWANLPVMRDADLVTFLKGDVAAELGDRRRQSAIKLRFPPLTRSDVRRVLQSGNFPTHQLPDYRANGVMSLFKAPYWLIGIDTMQINKFELTYHRNVWLVMSAKDGHLADVMEHKGRFSAAGEASYHRITWEPTPENIEKMRLYVNQRSMANKPPQPPDTPPW